MHTKTKIINSLKPPTQAQQVQLPQVNKFWNFIQNEATETTTENVELRITGDIISDDDAWIYEWLGIPCASPNTFRNELNQYKGKDIILWIDSCGGDVFAAAGIYNALMEHKNTGAKITSKIDSKAMSAATIPYMAGDEKLMSPLGIFMMHNPLTSANGYASDLRKVAEVLDTVKETIINAYQLGTGLSRDKISSMMDAETYMDAQTAVREGFADDVIYENNEESKKSVMNFAFNRLSIQNCANESVKHLLALESKNKTKIEEEKTMEIKNVGEFKAQLPDIHNEVYNSGNTDGIKAERDRLKAFDVLNGKVDSTFLAEEKYKDNATAENVLFKATMEGKVINASYVAQAQIDATNANLVPGSTSDNSSPDEATGILNFVGNVAKKVLGKEDK